MSVILRAMWQNLWQNGRKTKNYLKIYYIHITKNPVLKLPQSKLKCGIPYSKTKQYLENQKNKNNRQQREACRRFMVHPTGFEPVAF